MKKKLNYLLFVNFILILCFQLESSVFDYKEWWEKWYSEGNNSGLGSRNQLAQFKADTINIFLKKKEIQTVIEFGCGDGFNLGLIEYPYYLGIDVSRTSIKNCAEKFKNDKTKSFMLYEPKYFINQWFKCFDLVVCLDVLYHIIDEEDYLKVLSDIFSFSPHYVILYTTLYAKNQIYPEIKHRNVLDYLTKYPDYSYEIIPQKYTLQTEAVFIFLTKNTTD